LQPGYFYWKIFMNRSLVRLSKQIILDQKTTDPHLNALIDSIYESISFEFEQSRIIDFNNMPVDVKKRIQKEISETSKSSLRQLQKMYKDVFHPINEDLIIEDVDVKLVSANRNSNVFKILLYLISDQLTILDDIDGKLLVTIGNAEEMIKNGSPIRYPELINLKEDFSIAEYMPLNN
jgi:hypothetical protein